MDPGGLAPASDAAADELELSLRRMTCVYCLSVNLVVCGPAAIRAACRCKATGGHGPDSKEKEDSEFGPAPGRIGLAGATSRGGRSCSA